QDNIGQGARHGPHDRAVQVVAMRRSLACGPVGLTYLQAVIIGALQGVTELFPISSLGHAVLVPAWIGGSWKHLVTEGSAKDSGSSPYLAFIVALHCATALALLFYFWRVWVKVIG